MRTQRVKALTLLVLGHALAVQTAAVIRKDSRWSLSPTTSEPTNIQQAHPAIPIRPDAHPGGAVPTGAHSRLLAEVSPPTRHTAAPAHAPSFARACPLDVAAECRTKLEPEPAWDLGPRPASRHPTERGAGAAIKALKPYWPGANSGLDGELPHPHKVWRIVNGLPIELRTNPSGKGGLGLTWAEGAGSHPAVTPDVELRRPPSFPWVAQKLKVAHPGKGWRLRQFQKLVYGTLLQRLPQGGEAREAVEGEMRKRLERERARQRRVVRSAQSNAQRALYQKLRWARERDARRRQDESSEAPSQGPLALSGGVVVEHLASQAFHDQRDVGRVLKHLGRSERRKEIRDMYRERAAATRALLPRPQADG